MKCPVCNVDLVMSERQGVEVDYCPRCRGVWLDRGELDKILERSSEWDEEEDRHKRQYYQREHQPPYQHPYPQKRKSFWQELFD